MNTLIIKVKGMVCNGCENRIQNALKTIDGIIEVLADYKQELVTIKVDSEFDKNVIYEKIEDLGFEVEKEN
ncbi:MAG: heavy-metal-associated domain-containing protein [Lachnospiraceae bacterium]|nr:heavy-metal-associated domain-containing protein [Lachnospiraceae bacterium]